MNLKARAVFYFIFLMLFPFIWLLWVFPAACGLSLVAVSRGYSALQCTGFSWGGFSCRGSQAVGTRASNCSA